MSKIVGSRPVSDRTTMGQFRRHPLVPGSIRDISVSYYRLRGQSDGCTVASATPVSPISAPWLLSSRLAPVTRWKDASSHARYPQEPLTALRFESLRVGQARPGARDDPE
jgi:hypothetical protein